MKARYRMLLWEQSRTAGVLCLTMAAIALTLLFLIQFEMLSEYMQSRDAHEDMALVILGVLLVAAAALAVRQDGRAHLALDFEPRLLRLPAAIAPVVLIVFSMRLLFLCALGVLLYLSYFLLHGSLPEPGGLTLALNLFLLGQTLVWVRRSISGLSYLIPLAIVGACLVYDASVGVFLTTLLDLLSHPRTLPLILALSFALAWLGVLWQRRDECHGPPPPTVFVGWIAAFGTRTPPPFATVFEAQCWYEQRRVGRLLPLLTLVLTPVFAALFLSYPGRFFDVHTRFWFAPGAALLAAALITGPLSLRPGNRYPFARPQFASRLGLAILVVQLRALMLCFFMVSALSLCGMMASGMEGVLLLRMVDVGVTDILGAAMLVMRPIFTVCMIAWLLLWLTTLPVAIPALSIVSAFIVDASIDYEHYRWLVHDHGVMPIVLAAVALGMVAGLLCAARRKVFSTGQVVVGLCLFQQLTLLIWAASPHVGAYRHGIIACIGLAAMMLLPIVGVPLSLTRRKHKT